MRIGTLLTFLFAFHTLRLEASLADGLVGYWRFDEGQGSVANDASGHGAVGLLQNMPADSSQWVDGQIGGALHFRGPAARGYVRVSDFIRPNSTMTVSAWVWADSVPQWASIASCFASVSGPFYFGMLGSDPLISAYSADSSGLNVANVYSNEVLPLGSWHFVAFRIDGTFINLWQDECEAGSYLGNSTIQSSVLPLEIGGETHFDYPFQGFWDGKIDDVALWTRALEDYELEAIYMNGLHGQGVLPIPEPGCMVQAGLGLAMLAGARSLRRRFARPESVPGKP